MGYILYIGKIRNRILRLIEFNIEIGLDPMYGLSLRAGSSSPLEQIYIRIKTVYIIIKLKFVKKLNFVYKSRFNREKQKYNTLLKIYKITED